MVGLVWAAVIWGVTVVAVSPGGFRAFFEAGKVRIGRPHLAILLVLLGTHSTAARTGAADVMSNPLVVETVLRGVLVAVALGLVAPALLRNLAQASRPHRMVGLGALSLYGVVAGVSVLYSVAPLPTAGKVFELGVALAVVWALATEANPGQRLRDGIDFVVRLEMGLLAVAVVGFFVAPGIFAEVQGRPGFVSTATMIAPYAHSNGLSATGALVAAYALAQTLLASTRAMRMRWLAGAALGTVAVILASGRQGLAMWVAVVAVLLWVLRRRWLLVLVPLGLVLALTQWTALSASVWEIVARDQNPDTMVTWSGRFDYWDAAFGAWLEHPWTGYGFGVGGRFVALEGIGEDAVSSLHSGYMEALVGLGVLGVVPLVLAVVRTAAWCGRRLRAEAPYAILIVPLLLHTLVSLGFAGWLTADFVIFALLAAIADVGRRRRKPVGAVAVAEPRGALHQLSRRS